MNRRQLLGSIAVATTVGFAGCTGGPSGPATPTPSPTPTPSKPPQGTPTPGPTPAPDLGRLEYTVLNEDDESHAVEITMENGQGTVVHEQFRPALKPGEIVGSDVFGLNPERGPYPFTVSVGNIATTVHWEPTACLHIDLLVAITNGGQLSVEREHCVK